jgi:DNA-binding transcriptional ArsR family regulator
MNVRRTEEILKAISLGTSREILRLLAKRPMTVGELRRMSKRLRNRVSFYKSLNRMVGLGIVRRHRSPGVRGFVYGLSLARVSIDLRRGEVSAEERGRRLRGP